MNYYNEHDPRAAAWLRELIQCGHIAPGEVDQRDIQNVKATELSGFNQCHFFAGIGGWSLALRLAGISDDCPIWTGSCPCQPFSVAGKGMGADDERHLWPDFRNLIGQSHPPIVFGEQVASADGRQWLDGVSTDLEKLAYRFAAADLCAAGLGAPHIRQRLYWVADSQSDYGRSEQQSGKPPADRGRRLAGNLTTGRMADATSGRFRIDGSASGESRHIDEREPSGGLVQPGQPQLERHTGHGNDRNQPGRINPPPDGSTPATGGAGPWSRFDILPFRDGKTRRVESGTFPLVDGLPDRVGLLRGYGNAIIPQLAAQFIQACQEII